MLSRVSCLQSTLRTLEANPRPKSAVAVAGGDERHSGLVVADPEYIWDLIGVSHTVLAARRGRKLMEERAKANCMA